MRRLLPLLVILLIVASAQPAKSFLDFEAFLKPFYKKHKQAVHVINHIDSPIYINEARVDDRGSEHFQEFTGILDTYHLKVTNTSGRKILAYRVAWTLKHPFENWVFRKIEANSIDTMSPGASQVISFKRDKHYRQDAYYYAEISKVEFDDETIWKAPQHDDTMTVDDIIKQEIDSIEEKSVDELDLDELKNIIPSTTNGTIIEGASKSSNHKTTIEEVPQVEVIVE